MRDLWRRLEAVLKKQAPAALDFLNPPASEAEIRAAEMELGVSFPPDFAASLRIHNGQVQETGQPPYSLPFIPAEHEPGGIYRATFGELAPLSVMIDQTRANRWAIDDRLRAWAGDFEYDGPVRRDGNWSWLIFVDAGTGDTMALDLNPDSGGQVGQVLSILHDPSCLLVLAPSYRDWFETLVTRYESGRYVFVEEEGELEAIDRLDEKRHNRDESPEEPDEGNILRFPR